MDQAYQAGSGAASDARTRKQVKLRRLPFILAIVTLVPGIVQATSEHDGLDAILSTGLVVANLIGCFWEQRFEIALHIGVNLLDSAASFALAISLALKGTQYLHFAYIVAGLGFLATSVILPLRARRRRRLSDPGPNPSFPPNKMSGTI